MELISSDPTFGKPQASSTMNMGFLAKERWGYVIYNMDIYIYEHIVKCMVPKSLKVLFHQKQPPQYEDFHHQTCGRSKQQKQTIQRVHVTHANTERRMGT